MIHSRVLFYGIAAILVTACALSARAQEASCEVNTPYEITLHSARMHASPQRDVVISCTFRSPRGDTETVLGFWFDDRTYGVRFSPWEAGVWTWSTVCSDSSDTGLHAQTGEFTVAPYSGDDELRRLGWLRVSDTKRYLTYGNGEPFFYLSDTAWEMTCKSNFGQVRQYVSLLRSKGYNVVQLCILSHLQLGYHGVASHNGDAFQYNDAFRPGPKYYSYLDSIVTILNDSGLIAAMVPNWAYFTVVHGNPKYGRLLTYEEGVELARYVGARYAGHNVIWITAGDQGYETPEQKAYWTGVAEALRNASGPRHLRTIHTWGAEGSFHYFDSSAHWLDFHMFQSSHSATTYNHWYLALEGNAVSPPKPSLNAECNYEDLFTNFWLEDTTCADCFRLRPEHVRMAAWQSMLSGALVGMSHGANGVWQWHIPNDNPHLWPRFYVEQSWTMDSYDHIALLKRICQKLGWYRLVPRPELVVNPDNAIHLAISQLDSTLIAYFRVGQPPMELDVSQFGDEIEYYWMNPATAGRTAIFSAAIPAEVRTFTFRQPSESDWLLFVSRKIPVDHVDTSHEPRFEVRTVTSVADGSVALEIKANTFGTLDLRVVDLLGRLLRDETIAVAPGTASVPLPRAAAGWMYYLADFTASTGAYFHSEGKVVW